MKTPLTKKAKVSHCFWELLIFTLRRGNFKKRCQSAGMQRKSKWCLEIPLKDTQSWRDLTFLHLVGVTASLTLLTHLRKVRLMTQIWHPPLVWVNCHWSWTPCLRHQVSYMRKNIYFQIFVPNSSTYRYVIPHLQFLWVSPCIFSAATRAEYESWSRERSR